KNPPELKIVAALRHALVNDVCAQVRLEAIQSLLLLGPPTDKPTKLGLTQDLQKVVRTDRDKSIRVWAQVAWMQNTQGTTDRLGSSSGTLLNGPDLAARCAAARALGVMGKEAKSQVPSLIRALDDKDNLVVTWAIWALGQMGSSAERALPALQRIAANKE